MFEVDVDWISDNPLFEMDERALLDFHEEDDLDFRFMYLVAVPSGEFWSQDWCGELTTVAHLLNNPYMVSDSNLYMSWMDFILQQLNGSWWRIDEGYVLITGNGFSASLLLMAPMYLEVLQSDYRSIILYVPLVLISAIEEFVSYINDLGWVVTIYCDIYSSLIHFYLIIFDGHDNMIWDLGIIMLEVLFLWGAGEWLCSSKYFVHIRVV